MLKQIDQDTDLMTIINQIPPTYKAKQQWLCSAANRAQDTLSAWSWQRRYQRLRDHHKYLTAVQTWKCQALCSACLGCGIAFGGVVAAVVVWWMKS